MKPVEWLVRALRGAGSGLRQSFMGSLFRAPFRGGMQATLAAWRERFRKEPPDGVMHGFDARDYPGSRARRYLVHLPRGKVNRKPRPLVMVLHGCHQDHRDIEAITGFNRIADRHRFLVVYPFVTSYRGLRNRNCWGWWFDREIHTGAGEVEDLWQIIEDVKRRYPIDEKRIHVTGLSSGAGMAVAMMVAHAGKIASGAAVAGVSYAERATAVRHALNPHPRSRPLDAIVADMRAEMGEDICPAPIQIVHSMHDNTVPLQSAEVLRDSWGQCCGIDTRRPARRRTGCNGGANWAHSQYRDSVGRRSIETLILEGPGHGWYGGKPGEFSYPDAPDVTRWIWRFFKSHPLHELQARQEPDTQRLAS